VSEGDTSDEEDIEASNSKRSTRQTRKEGLELPSGSADGSVRPRAKRRKLVHVALSIAALVVTAAAIGGGIYASTKNSDSALSSPSTALAEEFATSSSIPVPSQPKAEVVPSTVEDENDSVLDSEANSIPKDDTLGLLEETVDQEVPSQPKAEAVPSMVENENDSVLDSEANSIPKDDTLKSVEETADHEDKDEKYVKNKVDGKLDEKESEDMKSRPTKWPDLVGMTGEEAKAQLELLCGDETYEIIVLNEDSPTTRDYRFSRIRIFTNDEGVVSKVPVIG